MTNKYFTGMLYNINGVLVNFKKIPDNLRCEVALKLYRALRGMPLVNDVLEPGAPFHTLLLVREKRVKTMPYTEVDGKERNSLSISNEFMVIPVDWGEDYREYKIKLGKPKIIIKNPPFGLIESERYKIIGKPYYTQWRDAYPFEGREYTPSFNYSCHTWRGMNIERGRNTSILTLHTGGSEWKLEIPTEDVGETMRHILLNTEEVFSLLKRRDYSWVRMHKIISVEII